MNTFPCGKKNPRRYRVRFFGFPLPSWKIKSPKVSGPILDARNLRRYVEDRQANINFEIQESRRYEEKKQHFFTIRVSHTLVEKKIIGGIIQNHLSPARDNTFSLIRIILVYLLISKAIALETSRNWFGLFFCYYQILPELGLT